MNIDSRVANAGEAAGFSYQPETERIKGNYPVYDGFISAVSFFENQIRPVLERSPAASRLTIRLFCSPAGEEKLIATLPDSWNGFLLRKEASVEPFPGFRWVWIGGNRPERMTQTELLSTLKTKYFACARPEAGDPGRYRIVRLVHKTVPALPGTRQKERIAFSSLSSGLLEGVPVNPILVEQAAALAGLYARRIPQNVTPNHRSQFITESLAGSVCTALYVLIDPETSIPQAAVVNEFTDYPVTGFPGIHSVRICESNDWVKAQKVSRSAFVALIRQARKEAFSAGAVLVEAECLPSAFRVASASGFSPAGEPLIRATCLRTDIPNPEHNDTSCDPRFRHFVSLFLYYCLPERNPDTHEVAACPSSS
ncbi:MAG: hypothetical protein N2691_00135 [Patescibacteria group bacterium]|nr:hypothetical protein [Patescibacteria group bacterium]